MQPRQLEHWIEAASRRGLQFVSVKGDVDLTHQDGVFTADIRVQIARTEVMRESQHQSRAQRQCAQMGKAPKGMRLFGYTVQGKQIEAKAEIVRAIFRAFAPVDSQNPSHSLRAIAASLSGIQKPRLPGLPKVQSQYCTVLLERNEVRRAQKLKLREVPVDIPWSP